MKNDYWRKRQDALIAGLDKKDEKFSGKLAKEYDRLQRELEKEIAYYYQKYGSDDILEYRTMMAELSDSEREEIFKDFDSFVQNHPEHANLLPIRNNIYKLNRLEGLQMSVRMKMAELGLIEQNLMTEYLKLSYKYGYEATMRNLKNTSSFFSINNSILQQALSDKWFNEKNYSDRIWDNKDTLRNWLINDLKDGIIAGKNYDAMIKSLMQRLNTGKFYAKRLVWTESAFFMNTANAQAFMEDGILRYQYTSIIDDRTSKICRKLNKQFFNFKDYKPGINAPPMHSFCRSTIVPIENDVKISESLNKEIKKKRKKRTSRFTEVSERNGG
ncbi:minor capsid protein [Enterococcus sp. AZ177]|uniref:minor capsid protein n=1 Tax=unclassified Enterococcus TaxID=2608891 RepID=UPI003D301016